MFLHLRSLIILKIIAAERRNSPLCVFVCHNCKYHRTVTRIVVYTCLHQTRIRVTDVWHVWRCKACVFPISDTYSCYMQHYRCHACVTPIAVYAVCIPNAVIVTYMWHLPHCTQTRICVTHFAAPTYVEYRRYMCRRAMAPIGFYIM